MRSGHCKIIHTNNALLSESLIIFCSSSVVWLFFPSSGIL
jgi:hypothetical protein